jgi:preprotein translocase subunit YajC
MSSYLNHVGVTVHGLILAAATSTTAAPKKTGSASDELIVFAILGLVVYFLVLRPRSQRMRRAQQQQRGANIGDEVMLTSGIIGRVTNIDGDRASVEIAPEIEVEVVRRAIGQVLTSADAELGVDVPPDPGYDEAAHDGAGDEDAHFEDNDEHGAHVSDDAHEGEDEPAGADEYGGDEHHDDSEPLSESSSGTSDLHVPGEAAGHLSSDGPTP